MYEHTATGLPARLKIETHAMAIATAYYTMIPRKPETSSLMISLSLTKTLCCM